MDAVNVRNLEQIREQDSRRVKSRLGTLVLASLGGAGIVVAVMMVTYVAVPARLIGVKSDRSRRDKLTATAVGGALGAVVCSPPYVLGRIGIILLGNKTLFFLGVILLIIAIPLQTGAVTATKAVKFSAKLVTTEVAGAVGVRGSGSTPKPVASATAVVEPAGPGGPPDPPDRGP